MSADRPEKPIVDAIDELVEEQLRHERSGYDHNINQVWCVHCGHEWHGMESVYGCPGAYADDKQVTAWKATKPTVPPVSTGSLADLAAIFDLPAIGGLIQNLCDSICGLFGISSAGNDLFETLSGFIEEIERQATDESLLEGLSESERAEVEQLRTALRELREAQQ